MSGMGPWGLKLHEASWGNKSIGYTILPENIV
jgi:hypothetical protein